jgi:glycosyltransferase involved in cell wall biosynthesis
MPKIKILYYNWVDFEDAQQRGGGVSIYQRNLVDAARQRGDEVWFLSSGVCYSPFSRRPSLREVKARKEGVRKFEIVNSPILSPGHEAFGRDVADAPEMETLFAAFLREHGPFDVVHFNNLEGIPISFLRLARQHHARTKIVYSVHNYFAFCPQVNLWFQEKAVCRDFAGGRKCVNCLMQPLHPRGTQRMYRVEYGLRKLGIRPHSFVFRFAIWLIFGFMRGLYHLLRSICRGNAFVVNAAPIQPCGSSQPSKAASILDPAEAARFAARRRIFVDALNTFADHVLAVSQRVAELTVRFGIDEAKVRTLYIGTRFAEQQGRAVVPRVDHPRRSSDVLRLVYLGYMRRDKGFYFFLKALQRMPAELARRLALTFAAKIVDPYAHEQIKRMAHRFASVTFYDGYTHAQLPEILSAIDLAVVPVLWEDNLPQVAIECVASGVPILTSDRGGAQELLGCRQLVFRAGSCADLHAKLEGILDNREILSTALAGRRPLYTPHEHYDSLREHYYRDISAPDRADTPERVCTTRL